MKRGGNDVRTTVNGTEHPRVRRRRARSSGLRPGTEAPRPQALSLTVVVPAFNEEAGISATLDALLHQTEPADRIVVVNDCSTDRTREIAESFDGVEVITPEENLGSKARSQNYALQRCDTDLILPVDGDTILAPDYIALVKRAFDDNRVVVAAGCVLTQHQNTVWERGRQIEYLVGFHWFRLVQSATNSPMVCAGCCSIFRRKELVEFGGFPERTLTEDIDYTFSQQIAGHRAVYVSGAVAYAAEPESARYMSIQLRRWKSGWFQNVRQHFPRMVKRKPMLALWVMMAFLEIAISPATLLLPVLALLVWHVPVVQAVSWWLLGESMMMLGPLIYGAVKRRISFFRILKWYPSFYVLKILNFLHDWRALITELVLVPLGLRASFQVYQKGH